MKHKKSLWTIILTLLLFSQQLFGFTAKSDNSAHWICFPGEYGIWAHKELMSRRTEKGQPVPNELARLDVPYPVVRFHKMIELDKPERASLRVDGEFQVKGIGGKNLAYDINFSDFELPAGKYLLAITVQNFTGFPSIWFHSDSFQSDGSWTVHTFQDDNTGAEMIPSTDPLAPPSQFAMTKEPAEGVVISNKKGSVLYDFGKETFGYPILHNVKGEGTVTITYGESEVEAMDGTAAETWDICKVSSTVAYNDTLPTKAFRYVRLQTEGTTVVDRLSMLYEYLPLERRGSFECSDTLLNRIYDVSYYTLHLCTREVHIDGIKRDRWAWSGDAYQSYLMNFYTFFDEDVNRRTFWGLRGHEPQTRHLNTIVDYSAYWLIGLYDHFTFTGDTLFIKQIYPRAKSTMEFCINRLNKNGMTEGKPSDWTFVDWAPIDKQGELSFEQFLFIEALSAVSRCAALAGDKATAEQLAAHHDRAKQEFDRVFWSDDKGGYLHNRVDGKVSETITRYTNMFAILMDAVSAEQKEIIKERVILNNDILPITTPYMKFYELAALCAIGEHKKVLDFVRSYWGGMLRLGATTFWEAYDPTLADDAHLSMYGRPYGKSLCHAWGANPLYLFGRYYLGVSPTTPAYETYVVEPHLAGLGWMKGKVPTPKGDIEVSVTDRKIEVKSNQSIGGVLKFSSKRKPKCANGTIRQIEKNSYQLALSSPNTLYTITY